MKPTMTWLKTADGVPEYGEVEGKGIVYHYNWWDDDAVRAETMAPKVYLDLFTGKNRIDRYIIIDPPIEEPLEYKRKKPRIERISNDIWRATWTGRNEQHLFWGESESKAIANFNAFVRSVTHGA